MDLYNQNVSLPEHIGKFRLMTSDELLKLKNMYSLSMGAAELEFCRNHYETVEKRDPVISELRLLDDLISRGERSPAAFRIKNIKSESFEVGRTYEDAASKLSTLEKRAPYSFSEISSAADLYIKRVGKKTSTPSLYGKCSDNGKLEFAAKGARELVRLEFSDIDSGCSVGIPESPPLSRAEATESDAFVLVSSLGCDFSGDFSEELSKILFAPRLRGLIKRAAPVEEGGVLPFLLSSAKGFFADISGFPGYDPNVRELRLLTRKIRSTVVLLCRKEALTALANAVDDANLRFLFFGRPMKTANSSVRYAGMFPYMINADFLRSLSFCTYCDAVVRKKDDTESESKITVKKSFIPDGIITVSVSPDEPSFHSVLLAVIRAVAEIAAAGVDFTDISVSFDSRLPLLGFDENRLGDALETLLGRYRAQAELCLLSEGSRERATDNELSFAIYARAKTKNLIPDVITKDSGSLSLLAPKTNESGMIDFDDLRRILLLIAAGVRENKISAIRISFGKDLENEIRKMAENAEISPEIEKIKLSPIVFIAESTEIDSSETVNFEKNHPDFNIL